MVDAATDWFRPRPLLLHFHNYEMLVAYGQGSRPAKSLLRETEQLTRYAVAVASGRLIILPKFLWEAEYFGQYLRMIRPLTSAGLLAYGGTTSDFGDDLGQKQQQYRDAPSLFPSYFDQRLSRQQLQTLDNLTWVQRLGPSATATISDSWTQELQPGGELADGLLAAVDRGSRKRIESALETVPDRLEGRAFVLREVMRVLNVGLDGETQRRINWLINRTYLRLYLRGLDAVVSHPGFDAVLVPWLSGPEKETVDHGTSPEVLRRASSSSDRRGPRARPQGSRRR